MPYEEMLKILTDGGLTREQAEKFIEAERATYADRPAALRGAVAEWREIAALCRAVDAPQLVSRFLLAGVSLNACAAMLRMNVSTKGARPLTLTPAARQAVAINLLALAHSRGRIAA